MAARAALLVAVETYFEAGPPVPYAANDLAELHRLLPVAGYDAKQCALLAGHRTTKAVIESTLKRLPKFAGEVETLLVLFAGRAFNVKGKNYLACADTIAPDPTETALALGDLVAALKKVKAQSVVLLLDADPLELADAKGCAPGFASAELEAAFAALPDWVGLTSCEPGERSFESNQQRRGIWRGHLLEAFTGKVRAGVGKDGALTARVLHAHLCDAVPRTLRRAFEDAREQVPQFFGSDDVELADLSKLLGPGTDLLDPARMKRVAFRAESRGRIKDLAGYRKSHTLPERANDWARKYVNRTAAADIKTDLDTTFEMVREVFGYKRKDLDVSAERDGLGFIRTPDFEYTVTVEVDEEEPSDVIWRRDLTRLSGAAFVRSAGFRDVFGSMFNKLVFEFDSPVDVAEFVDRIEDSRPEGVKVSVAADSGAAVVTLAGFAGRVSVTRTTVLIEGPSGNPGSLLEQFLAFLAKFGGLGEPKSLPPAAG